MDEHIRQVLKMLEEGKISAAEAEKLLSALRPSAPPPPSQPNSPFGSNGPRSESRADSHAESASSSERQESAAKSFEFSWSHKRAFPFDLSGLGKQISDAVKKLDPEKMVREARTGVTRGGKRWQDRMKEWARFMTGEDGKPENTLGQPTARATENLVFNVTPDATLQIDNSYGAIYVVGGADAVSIEIEKEAWAATDEEAQAKLRELKAEALTQQSPEIGASRLEIRVTAPEEWRDGWANLRVRVPTGASLKLETVFGDLRVENAGGRVEAHTISGSIDLDNLRGDTRAEGISGDIRAANIGGALRLASKSGDLHVETIEQGGEITAVSGSVHVRAVEGARLEARSVSGDVEVAEAGRLAPLDLTIESVSGDIAIKRSHTNSMRVKTISGDAEVDDVEALTIQSETVSGDVELKLSAPFHGTLTANTVSGDVGLKAPQTSSFRFTLGTQSGDLECDLTAHDTSKSDTLYSGTVGSGDGTITIQTRSGDVKLRPHT